MYKLADYLVQTYCGCYKGYWNFMLKQPRNLGEKIMVPIKEWTFPELILYIRIFNTAWANIFINVIDKYLRYYP